MAFRLRPVFYVGLGSTQLLSSRNITKKRKIAPKYLDFLFHIRFQTPGWDTVGIKDAMQVVDLMLEDTRCEAMDFFLLMTSLNILVFDPDSIRALYPATVTRDAETAFVIASHKCRSPLYNRVEYEFKRFFCLIKALDKDCLA